MATDNAASRMLELLMEAKKIDPNAASIHAWQKLLQTKDSALLLSRLGKMIALPEKISAALSNSVETAPGAASHISNQFFNAFTSHKFSDKWEHFITKIDSHMINYLALASTLLETKAKTTKLIESDLEELRSSFVDILDKVRDSELTPRLKSYVVSQLHDLISAIDDYFITGAEPILERIESTLGHGHIDKEFRGFLNDHELGKSLLDCLGAAASLVTVAIGVPQLTLLIKQLQQLN